MKHPPSVAIVGYGAVGRAVAELFPGAKVYDPALGFTDRDAVNVCRFAFVCVPTPEGPGGACDVSAVEDTIAWLEAGVIVLRSTVPPGTTGALAARFRKRVVFQPEYGPGDTPGHPYRDVRTVPWVILGGPREWTRPVAGLYKRVFNSNLEIRQTDAVTAELTKYMENAFLAVKVAFCNEFYDLACRLGVDYDELRELWLLDPRVGRSHTWVHEDDRGFGGPCLPKDLRAIVELAGRLGLAPVLLEAALRSNEGSRGTAE